LPAAAGGRAVAAMTAQPGTKRPAPSQYDLTNRQCQQILKALMKHKAAWPFLVPVDPVQLNIPDYFDVIKEPMDLGTVSAKLSKNSYAEPEEFVREVRLVFENAMRYNRPGTDVYSMAEEVLTEFERKVKQHARPPAPQAVPGAAAAPPPEPPVPVAEPADPGAAQNADEDPEEALPQLTMRQCSQLLRPLMRTDEAVMCFNVPVDPDKLNIPDYFSVIVHPMDFGTIDDRLDRNMYADSADFIKDVRLVFSNAKTYNPPGSAVHIMAKKVEDMFERELAKLAAPKPAAHPLSRQQSAPKIPVAAVQAAAPPETPEIVSALCKPILKALRQHTHAKAFNQPVDVRKFPHYTTVISTPMDLRLVAKRLDKGEYATLDACHADVNLIWSNCRTFNGEVRGGLPGVAGAQIPRRTSGRAPVRASLTAALAAPRAGHVGDQPRQRAQKYRRPKVQHRAAAARLGGHTVPGGVP